MDFWTAWKNNKKNAWKVYLTNDKLGYGSIFEDKNVSNIHFVQEKNMVLYDTNNVKIELPFDFDTVWSDEIKIYENLVRFFNKDKDRITIYFKSDDSAIDFVEELLNS